jgi:ribosome-binding ATPase YchF (GTP1/OBG family)
MLRAGIVGVPHVGKSTLFIAKTSVVIPATIEFVDIAGVVKGHSDVLLFKFNV